jgi:hypothetical protein
LHPDVAARKIDQSHAEVVAVVERMGIADEELAGLLAEGGGPEVDRVVQARALSCLARAVEDLSKQKGASRKKAAPAKEKASS